MKKKLAYVPFLKDVLFCSLGAYGGPEAHYGVFTSYLVEKKAYLTEEELVELIALTSILSGPSSTQTIVAIGHKLGGPILALLTMIVWSLPVILIMSLLSFSGTVLSHYNMSEDSLRFVAPMSLAFIFVAAFRISQKVVKGKMKIFLFLLTTVLTLFFRSPWFFPLILASGGVFALASCQERLLWKSVKISPPWGYFFVFISLALGSLGLSRWTYSHFLTLFEQFYRYGYLVIGGGQVVVPLMTTELVDLHHYLTHEEFLRGFGFVQGLPGPMFSFSAYVGGMAAREFSSIYQFLAALGSGMAIFLPGLLLIYFVYPVWESVRHVKGIKVLLSGVTPVTAGLILSSGLSLMTQLPFSIENILVVVATFLALLSRKIYPPVIVLVVIGLGIVL